MFEGTARTDSRSIMNVCFVMAPEYKDLEKDFIDFATEFFTITRVTPAGARFFCAPAYMRSYLLTSTGRLNISELMSATIGTGESGSLRISVP